MKKRLAWLLMVCFLLTGCGNLLDGHYSSVKPHEQHSQTSENQSVSARNYDQLYGALEDFVEAGRTDGIISVEDYDQSKLEADISKAIGVLKQSNPVAAYAVDSIRYELGKSGGADALALEITYIHNLSQILSIKTAGDNQTALGQIKDALQQCETELILRIKDYKQLDFVQAVENYALGYPQFVMEIPQVSVNIYPETGTDRVVELRFTYQTNRDSLRGMRQQVEPVFESALLYVSGDGADKEKFSQLYSFLAERYDYQITTSITPAYSLLRHGVGDSRAFATVYAAMCRQAGLECLVVSGTYNGESRYWNIVCDDGIYYHVDLLEGSFSQYTDGQMIGFVWDYSAYPQCGMAPIDLF